MVCSKAAVPYFGGKGDRRLANWILQHFPRHTHYWDVFGGSGAMLLFKERSLIETYSDCYYPAYNFLQVCRDNYAELIETIGHLLDACAPRMLVEEPLDVPEPNPVFQAARFYCYCHLSWSGGGTRWSTGLAAISNPEPTHLLAVYQRLQGVKLLYKDAFQLIPTIPVNPDHFIYVDPPYLPSVRKSKDDRHANPTRSAPRRQYKHELSEAQHEELLRLLQGRNAVISGFPSDLYQDTLRGRGWAMHTKRLGEDWVEAVWVSPLAQEQIPQLSLLTGLGVL